MIAILFGSQSINTFNLTMRYGDLGSIIAFSVLLVHTWYKAITLISDDVF